MRKLTPKMLEVLREMAEPGVIGHYMPYMGRFREHPYYFITTKGHKTCTAQIKGLAERGLVERFDESWNGHKVRISRAGRKCLRNGR